MRGFDATDLIFFSLAYDSSRIGSPNNAFHASPWSAAGNRLLWNSRQVFKTIRSIQAIPAGDRNSR